MAHSIEHHPRAWARLRVDVNCALRRGAWYRVVRLTRDNVLLEVAREQVPVSRRLVKTMFARPRGVPGLPGSRAAQRVSPGAAVPAVSRRVRRRVG